jgi:hypothetical protein
MQCLIDFIGVRAPGAPVPASGLYLNDLPGIDLKSIKAITDADQGTWTETWQVVQRRAASVFQSAITNALSPKYRLHRVIEAIVTPQVILPEQTKAASNEYRGIYITMPVMASPLQQWYLSTIDLYLADTASTVVKVYQVNGQVFKELDSFTITDKQGMYHLVVDRSYTLSGDVYIGYDALHVRSVSLPITGDDMSQLSYMQCRAATWDGTTIAPTNDSYGLSASYNLQCSYDALVGNMRQPLAVAWWYLLGAELMAERIYTDRINRYTTIDLNKAKDLREEFKRAFIDELQSVADGLDLSTDSCIACNALLTSIESHP